MSGKTCVPILRPVQQGDILLPNLDRDPRLSPFLVPPEAADPFDRVGSATLASGANATLISIKLTGNELARLSGFGLAIDPTIVPNTDIEFRLMINKVRHRDFGLVKDFIGALELPSDIFVKIGQLAALIELMCFNVGAATTYNVAGRLQGWTFTN